MFSKNIVRLIHRTAEKWRTDLALPFESVLPVTVVLAAAALEGIVFRDRVFPPCGHALGLPLSSPGRGWLLQASRQPRRGLLPTERAGAALL